MHKYVVLFHPLELTIFSIPILLMISDGPRWKCLWRSYPSWPLHLCQNFTPKMRAKVVIFDKCCSKPGKQVVIFIDLWKVSIFFFTGFFVFVFPPPSNSVAPLGHGRPAPGCGQQPYGRGSPEMPSLRLFPTAMQLSFNLTDCLRCLDFEPSKKKDVAWLYKGTVDIWELEKSTNSVYCIYRKPLGHAIRSLVPNVWPIFGD